MDGIQSWSTGFNSNSIRPIKQIPVTQQLPVPQGMSFTLTREEQMEAKRLAEESNFSFDGYQVVRREFISHVFDPAMTVRKDSVTFNNSCISKLEDATYIQFLINPTEKKLIIRPCDIGARDAVRWCTVKSDKRKSRKITCKEFAKRLYEMLNWDTIYRYRLQGMKIHYHGEQMYLFDLSATECFLPQTVDANGKRKKAEAVLPEEWNNNFGMNVEEHDMSTKVDFLDGYITATEAEDMKMEESE